MGQKVNPHGFRVGVIKNWDSRWYAKDEVFGDTLVNDYNVRKYLKKRLMNAGIPRIEIERDNTGKIRVYIHCAKPGMIIGRDGAEIEKLRADLEKMTGAAVSVNVIAVKPVEMSAQLVAENIASQLERRIGFRRAMKQSIGRTMRMGAKGIKISVSGRLGGAEIARSEHYHEGTIPLQTLRADIDYGFWEANTTYGKIGVKVWIYKGEVLPEVARVQTGASEERRQQNNRRDNRGRGDRRDGRGRGDRRDNRNGGRRDGGRGGFGGRTGGQGPRQGQGPRNNSEGGAK
ncbi:MAG: 30S ribosomal protein S3 [Clostridiales bacterium]|jgi:small subunit ribosomal protein S3|nr:30S ribosomal protein S3 [Clostridiales bacterium]